MRFRDGSLHLMTLATSCTHHFSVSRCFYLSEVYGTDTAIAEAEHVVIADICLYPTREYAERSGGVIKDVATQMHGAKREEKVCNILTF